MADQVKARFGKFFGKMDFYDNSADEEKVRITAYLLVI